MCKHLKAILQDGETVAWASGPELPELLDADNGNRILLRWLLLALLTLTLLSLYVGFGGKSPAVVTPVVAAALWGMLAPLVELRRISKDQRYYITNQRVILGGKNGSFSYLDLSALDALLVVTGRSGRRSLVLGPCQPENCLHRLRWLTLHPQRDAAPGAPTGRVVTMTFYEPRNVEGALVLLHGRTVVRECRRRTRSKGADRAA